MKQLKTYNTSSQVNYHLAQEFILLSKDLPFLHSRGLFLLLHKESAHSDATLTCIGLGGF